MHGKFGGATENDRKKIVITKDSKAFFTIM